MGVEGILTRYSRIFAELDRITSPYADYAASCCNSVFACGVCEAATIEDAYSICDGGNELFTHQQAHHSARRFVCYPEVTYVSPPRDKDILPAEISSRL